MVIKQYLRLSCLFLCVLFGANLACAQDINTKFTNLDHKILARDLDVANFLFKLGDEIEAKSHLNLSDSSWAKDLEDASMEFMKRAYAEGPDERSLVEKFRHVIKWKSLWQKTKEMSLVVKAFGRYKGLAAAFILVTTAPSDIYVPAILAAIGKPEYIAVVTIIPITGILLSGENMVRKFQSTRRIEDAIGGKAAYKDFLNSRKEVMKSLQASGDDYLQVLSAGDEELEAVLVKRGNIFQRILSRLGLKSEAMTFNVVTAFCEERGLTEDRMVKTILSHSDYPEEIRLGMLLKYFYNSENEEIRSAFMESFSKDLHILRISESRNALWDLYQDLVKSKNLDEVRGLIYNAPVSVSSKDLALLWKEKLLPEWSKSMDGVSLFEFRRMVNGFDHLFGRLLSDQTPDVLDESMKEEFYKYFNKVSPPGEQCLDALRAL